MPINTVSANFQAEGRSARGLALLLVLLIPSAIGALWVVRNSSHGFASHCDIDGQEMSATFIWSGFGPTSRIRSVGLELRKQVSQERVLGPATVIGQSWAISRLAAQRFELNQWGDSPSTSIDPVYFTLSIDDEFKLRNCVFVDGAILALMDGSTTSRVRLIDPTSSNLLDELELSGADYFSIPIPKTSYFFIRNSTWGMIGATGRPAPINKLARVVGGKIEIIQDFGLGYIANVVDESGDVQIVSLSVDGKSLEVRNASNRELKASIELPAMQSGIPVSQQVSVGASWVYIPVPMPDACLDLLTANELSVPKGCRIEARHRESKRMLVASYDPTKAQLIDEETGAVIAEIALRNRILSSAFVANGEQLVQLVIAGIDQRIIQLDASNGRVLQDWQPYWFIPLLEFFSAVVFLAWSCAWLGLSARAHRHAWIDCALITGLCVGYIIIRSQMLGFSDDVVRPIYQLSEGIFATWLILSSLWLVLGRTRLSLRILPQIGLVGIICLAAMICIGFQNSRVWELIIAAGMLSLWLVVAFLPLRFLGYRFAFIELTAVQESKTTLSRGAIPLRDLFLLTAVLAGVMAVARIAPSTIQFTVDAVMNLFVLVISITLTGIAAARVGFSQRSLVARFLPLLAAVAFGMLLPLFGFATIQGWKAVQTLDVNFLFWELRLHASTAIATIVCTYAFRLRGWRLTRMPLVQPT